MPRKKRVEKIGFYHIINRGVARHSTYHDDEDFSKFLEITQEASDEFCFEIFSFCLMNNHYHFLLKTTHCNLSLLMQRINSRYSVYYNHKYKRVGPLWQGRFKSWFVYDELYLKALVKYIEFNPIKAHITQKIGVYKWAMSSFTASFSMLNFDFISAIHFDEQISSEEQNQIEKLYEKAVEQQDNTHEEKSIEPLESCFSIQENREISISNAIKQGHSQAIIAQYLGISKVTVSKEYNAYKSKRSLFKTLKNKGIFQNHHENITYDELGETLFIQHVLTHAQEEDKQECLKLFGKRKLNESMA